MGRETGKSEGCVIGFTGADAHRMFEAGDENLAVADLAGLGGCGDGLDGAIDLGIGDSDLDLDFGQETHGVFGAAIDFGVDLLSAVPLHFRDREARNANGGQGIADLFQLERLDDSHHDLHVCSPLGPACRALSIGTHRAKDTSRAPAGSYESKAVPTRALASSD